MRHYSRCCGAGADGTGDKDPVTLDRGTSCMYRWVQYSVRHLLWHAYGMHHGVWAEEPQRSTLEKHICVPMHIEEAHMRTLTYLLTYICVPQ